MVVLTLNDLTNTKSEAKSMLNFILGLFIGGTISFFVVCLIVGGNSKK